MVVSLCFFLSGAAALILQVLWTRMLGHVFGATALAVSTTLTAFMGGLALGAYLGGKRAPTLKRPLLAFAVLETSVGLYGLLVPSLFDLLPTVQRLLGDSIGQSFFGYSLLRFVLVAVVLLLPTTAMGATLPILAEGVVKTGRDVASKVGELYAANTLGAMFGAFMGGFVLIPGLGLRSTMLVAAAMDLLVAGAVLLLFRWAGGERILLKAARMDTPDAVLALLEPVDVVDASPRAQRAALVVFAVSGGAAMALEVLWTRAVSVVIGASTYAFTLILCTFLIGLASGAAWMTRRIDRVKNPILGLAWAEVSVGILGVLGTIFVDKLPLILHSVARSADATMSSVYFANFFISALVMLPATFALGTVMPLVVRALAPTGADHAGPIVGRAYTLNTFGCILGSFAGGFVILPLIGVQHGLWVAALTNVALGVGLAILRGRPEVPEGEGARQGRPTMIFVTAAAAVALVAVTPAWNVPAWTAGLFRYYLAKNVYYHGWDWRGKLLFHQDGIATTVTVEGAEDGVGVSLKVNGKVDASDIGDMPTQILSGLLPLLVHPEAQRVLVIGFGSGVTSGAVLEAPVKKLDLVEIESAVLEASSRFFAHVNHEPRKDPRFSGIIDDGRNFLLTHDQPYDVIISEPSNPWMTGASSLFTKDFFEIAQRRLSSDGVFLQWLQLYELSGDNVNTLFSTFHSVFPYVVVFSPSPRSNDTLVLGAKHPIALDRENIARALADAKLGPELGRAEIHVPEDFFGLFLQGSAEVERLTKGGRINTDDNALIEFGAPQDLLEYSVKDAEIRFLEDIDGMRFSHAPPHFRGFGLDRAGGLITLAERLCRQGRLSDATEACSKARSSTAAPQLLPRIERVEAIIERLREADQEAVVVANDETKADETYARGVMVMLKSRERDALATIEQVDGFEKRGPAHRFLHAYLCYRVDRTIDAEYLLEDVLANADFVRENPSVYYYAARIKADRGRYEQAYQLMTTFLDRAPPREKKHLQRPEED
ncbi:MAG: fused MFS/spermidine synthase [Myxococcota bacterium]